MNREKDIQKRVDEALESLNAIKRAEPTPFFYTRLRARMEKEQKNAWERLAALLAKPAVATMSLVLILAINAFFLVRSNESPNTTSSGPLQGNSISEDYFTIASNSFDYENLEQ
jgi:hypothetical protein